MQKEGIWSRSFIMLCLTNFFLFMTFYTQVATLPLFVQDKFSHNSTEIGLVLTLFVAGAVLSRFFAGLLMTHIGHKKLLIAALTLFLIVNILYLFSGNYVELLILRLIHGISFGIATSTAATVAAELTPPKRMGTGIGYYGMFMSLAMVIGPFLGLTIIQHSPFFDLFALCILCSVFGLLAFLLVKVPRHAPLDNKNNNVRFTWKHLIEPKALPISTTGFALAIAYSGISAFVSVYGKHIGLLHITNYFFAVFALLVVIPRPVVGKLFDTKGENSVVYPGILCFLLGLAFLSQVNNGIGYLGAAALIGLGYGVLFPGFQALAVNSASGARKGFAMSTFLLCFDAGTGIGSLILGVIAGRGGFRIMYLTCACIVVLMTISYYMLHHRVNRAGIHQMDV